MVQSKLCYMTNVKKAADPNVALFPRKSYREKKTKSSSFTLSFNNNNKKKAHVSLCKAYNYVVLLL